MVGLCLFCLPFSFFYAKNVQDSEEQDLFRGEADNDLANDINETPGKFAMKGFDSSSEEEEDDNLGLLELDSDDDEIDSLQTPKLGNSNKKKGVSENKVLFMSVLLTLFGKQRANKFIHGLINARNAIVQTFSLIVLLVLFLSICFFLMKLFHHHVILQNRNKIYHTLINDFMTAHQNLSLLIDLILALMMFLGMVLNAVYLSFGLTGLPLLLIKGTKSLEDENDEVTGSIHQVREQLRKIQEKYQKNHKNIVSQKDRHLLKKLRKEEKMLETKQILIANKIDKTKGNSTSTWRYISVFLRCLTPFRVAIGITCLVMSSLLYLSILTTTFERVMKSSCGLNCGFLLERHTYFNFLDSLLVQLSAHFKSIFGIGLYLDKVCFVILMLYLQICALFGIVKFGIHGYLGINFEGRDQSYLFKLKKRNSYPQALTLTVTFMTLMLFSIHMQMSHFLPQYITFGHQHYRKDT